MVAVTSGNKKKKLLYGVLIVFLITILCNTVLATNFILPDGNAPIGMQYDGNFVNNNTTYLTSQDQTEITRIASEGYNVLSMDVAMKWVWKKYTGVVANDFNFDGIDAVCHYAYNTYGMYCSIQGIIDGTGYWNTSPYTFLDTNFPTLTKENTMRDFKSTSTAFTQNTNNISIWSNDINKIYTYGLGAMAAHVANDPAYAIIVAAPNEGFYTRLGIENTMDANNAWYLYKQSKYASVAAMNTAYGTAYADWNNAVVRTTSDSFQMQYDWWTMKSNRAGLLYSEMSRIIKLNAPNKLITSIKITNSSAFTLSMGGTSGTGRDGFLLGIDLNNYIYTATHNLNGSSSIDAIAYDAYPDQTDLRLQSLILDVDYGFIKGLGDYYNKPIYLGEVFPTVKSQAPHARGSNLAQQLLQSLAYVGSTSNLGIRGASIFSWNWSGCAATWGGGADSCDRNLSIKDTNSENILRQIIPILKSEYKNGINTTKSQIAICNNTNLDQALQLRYFHDEPLWGFIDAMKRKTTSINNYYMGNCNTSTENALYVNQINYKPQDFTDINTMAANGKTIIAGYRGLENTDANASVYGDTPSWDTLWRNTQSETFFGQDFTYVDGNVSFDVNVVDNNHVLYGSNLAKNTPIFRCRSLTNRCDREQATVTTALMDANGTSNKAMITDNNVGIGKVIKFNWNLYDLITNNTYQTNFDKAMKGILQTVGMLPKPYDLNASYGWETSNGAMFNAFGTTNYTYQPDNTATYLVMKIVDNNTVTFTTSYTGQIDINLTSGQAMWFTKDLNSINIIDPTLPVTTIVKTKIISTADNNISLTCADTNGCRIINWKVDNGSWNDSSIDGYLPNQVITLPDTINGSFITPEYARSTTTFDNNKNYLKRIEFILTGGKGGTSLCGYAKFQLIYKNGLDYNTATAQQCGLTSALLSYTITNDGNEISQIKAYVWVTNLTSTARISAIQYYYDKNYTNQLTNSQTNFIVSGAGSHTVQYYSQSLTGKTELTKSYTWSDSFSTTTTTTMSYTIPDNNNQATISIICSDTTYGCLNSYYYIDNNTTPNLYSTPFIFTGTGQHTITYYSTNLNYEVNVPTTSDLNMPVFLTIKYPKNIATLVQLSEKWVLLSTGGVVVNLTDLDADRNVYVVPGILTTFYISDVNGNYIQNTFTKTYYTDSNNSSTDTLQPYLYAISTSLSTVIYTKDAYTSSPVPNVTIKIYGNLPGIGYTLIGQVTTDSKGQALALFIAGQAYTFDVYYAGSLIKTFNITASSTSIYIYLYLPGTVVQPVVTGYGVIFNPVSTGLNKTSVGNQVFTQTVSNLNATSTTYVSSIIQNGVVLSTQTYTGSDTTKTFTRTIAWASISKGTLISRLTINGKNFDKTYFVNDSFGTNYNLLTGLTQGLRSDAQCPASGLCFPLMIIGIIISIALVVGVSFMLGAFQTQSAGIAFVVGMALFTYLNWIPIELTALVVIILLAFLVNERRS